MLADLDSKFLLDFDKLICVKEEKLSGTENIGDVYCGVYENQAVAIKLYTKGTNPGEVLKELRSENKVLQQLYHPCLVCMVGCYG